MLEEPVGVTEEAVRDDGALLEETTAEAALEAEAEAERAVTFASQGEFDRVLGKRIEQERRKWQRENEALLRVGEFSMKRFEGLSGEEAQQRAAEEYYEHLARKLDISPQAAEYIAGAKGGEGGPAAGPGRALPERLPTERVEGLFREEEEIREDLPDFDVVEFAGSSELVAALIGLGYPLKDIVEEFGGEARMERVREQTEREVLERIRARNAMPAPVGGYGQAETEQSVRAMTDAQIEAIDRAVRAGKRVTL